MVAERTKHHEAKTYTDAFPGCREATETTKRNTDLAAERRWDSQKTRTGTTAGRIAKPRRERWLAAIIFGKMQIEAVQPAVIEKIARWITAWAVKIVLL